jgi:hypothetical protein
MSVSTSNKLTTHQGVVVWDDQWDEDKREGEFLQVNGKVHNKE